MPPEAKNNPDQTRQQADYARQLESQQRAEKRQDSPPSPLPVSPPPQPPAQESSGEESPNEEEQPITHSYPEGQVSKEEQPNVARQLRDKIEQARKEYLKKMIKEGVKQAVKKGWQWLLRSAIMPLLAALGAVSWWVWLIIGIIIVVGVILAGLIIYAKNDPCGFRSDMGYFWAAAFFSMIGESKSIIKVCK